MPISLPSTSFAIVDAPEIKGLDVSFVYNFFIKDEKVNDSGLVSQKFIQDRSSIDFKQSFIDSSNFNRFVPRYNKIVWESVSLNDKKISPVPIKDCLSKIYNETSFTIEEYSSVQFQDSSLKTKAQFFMRRLAEELDIVNEDDDSFSVMDMARLVNEQSPNSIMPEIIIKALEPSSDLSGQYFLDPKTGKTINATNPFEETSKVGFRVQVNNKVINKAINSATNSVLSNASTEVSKILDDSKNIQEKAISQNPGSLLDGSGYDFELRDFIEVEAIDTSAFKPENSVVGYIISKTEILPNGNQIIHDPIVVESPFVNSTVDLKVRYDSVYQYSVQSIVLIKIQAEDVQEGQVVAISFLVSSKPSATRTVVCSETVAPPVPADFAIDWDYDKSLPRISWNFPVTSQRDVKYFQVFKRANINEPFQMVKMYDFNDSVVPTVLKETPEPRLVEKLQSPRNYYNDVKYTNDNSEYPSMIYAVCALDAHGFSSGYSTQILVKFDRYSNKLVKTIVSTQGAPKAYPNMNLKNSIFVESFKDSKHNRLKVVFTPEFLKVVDSQNNDLKLIKTSTDARYKIQMINVDLQEQQIFDINILDLT